MKLKLRLDDLQVDTFQTTLAPRQKGTVFAEQCTCYTQCTCPGCPSCANYATCDASCNGTCGASCNGTCGASCNGTCDALCSGTCNDTYDESCNGTCYDMTCEGGCAGTQGFSYCEYTCYNGVLGLYC